jgi:hypothetical protein
MFDTGYDKDWSERWFSVFFAPLFPKPRPPICTHGDFVAAAAQVTAARNTLLALPIGDGQQTDVSPAGQTGHRMR